MSPPFLLHLLWKGSQTCDLGWAGRRTLSWGKPSNTQKNYTTCYFRESRKHECSPVMPIILWGEETEMCLKTTPNRNRKWKVNPSHSTTRAACLPGSTRLLCPHGPELSLCDLPSTHAWWSDQGWCQNLFWEEGLEVRSSSLLACVQGRNYQIHCVSSIGHVVQEIGAAQEEHLKPHTCTKQGRPISGEEWRRHVKEIYKEKGKKNTSSLLFPGTWPSFPLKNCSKDL